MQNDNERVLIRDIEEITIKPNMKNQTFDTYLNGILVTGTALMAPSAQVRFAARALTRCANHLWAFWDNTDINEGE